MKASLLAVALLATIAISSAVDEECVQRKLRGLAVHWPNPTDCNSFYRCTNKDVKRSLLCPAGKEYNPKTGRCANLGKNLCKLSLTAPLADATNPCADEVSGTFVPQEGSCRSFSICNDNMAYAQNCDAGSLFNTTIAACQPDPDTLCWENLCLSKDNGVMVANTNDCNSFYVCNQQIALAQACPAGSYFDKNDLNCQPGDCPTEADLYCDSSKCVNADDYTLFPALNTLTGFCTCINQKPVYNECPIGSVFVQSLAVCVAQDTVCPSSNCLNKPDYTNFPAANTTTGFCTCLNNEASYNTCADDSVFVDSLSVCVAQDKVCPSSNCLNKPDYTNFPAANTTTGYCTCLNNEASYNTCADDSVFDESLSICVAQDNVCPSSNCLNKPDYTNFPAANTTTGFCTCLNNEATYRECPDDSIFDESLLVCVAQDKVCPSSNCLNIPDCTNFPAANTTTGYCKCVNNEATYYDCPADSIFDATTAVCVAQNTVCPSSNCLNKPDYTNFPAANTTTGYCTCLNNEASYYECPDDSIFDESVAVCVAQDKVCPSSNCLNIHDCTNFPAANTTTGYCKCVNNEATYYDCPADNVFDVTAAICVPQNTACSSCNCLNQPDYTNFPAANTTTGYCTCLNNEAIYHDCAVSGYTYDTELGFCVKLPSDDCEEETPSPLLCDGVYSEGDFVPNVDNCMLFFICFEGELIESTCGTGNYYDDNEKVCLPDTEGKCPACTEAAHQATNERNKRSIKAVSCVEGDMTPHPSDPTKFYICDCDGNQVLQDCGVGNYFNPISESCETDCTCAGGYIEGQLSAHPTDCDKYYICHEGTQVLNECGTDNYFNEDTLMCEKDINNECSTKTDCTCAGGYIEGQLSAHPTDCDKYYICHAGSQILHECGTDNYFNEETLLCEKDVNNVCFTKTNCTCPGGYLEGEMSAHPTECFKYYICSNSKQVLMDCGINNYFNGDECVVDTEFKCRPNVCIDSINGQFVANSQQCNAYFSCDKQKPTAEVCKDGDWFDVSKLSCQPDVNAVCYNPCADNETISLFPHPDPSKYYFCNGPQTIVGTCINGIFNATLGICQSQIVVNPCDGQSENYAFVDPEDNTQFYVCQSGVPVLYSCEPNTAFDSDIRICLPISDPDCDPTPCNSTDYVPPFATLNKTEDNAFCLCRGDIALKNYCETDMVFNNDIGVCFSTAPCDPSVCRDGAEYTVAPNRNDTNSFCLCVSEIAVIVDCPDNGTFNPFTLLCSNVEISNQCDQFECIDQADYYIFSSSSTNATDNGFCMCRDQIATFIPCGEDTQFNEELKICQLNNINCDSKECVGLPNNSKIPALTTTNGCCECDGDTATFIECPSNGEFNAATQECIEPACAPDLCDTADDFTSFPASNTITGFCFCMNNNTSPEYRDCPEEQEFNETVGVCIRPLPGCEDSMCIDLPEFSAVPAWNSTQGFCLCSGSKATYESCPPNNVFNPTTGVCNIDTEGLCGDKTHCESCLLTNTCKPYAANNNVNGFCLCYGATVPNFVACPTGLAFDTNYLICLATPESNCDVSLCANATIDNPISSPTLSGNTSFCYCPGPDDIMLLNCPDGKYYNDDLKLCTNLIEESCSCPNGMLNGDIVGDDSACNKYFVCLDGVMHENTCAAGEYFDVASSRCCVDTKGVCATQAQTAFTCLGAYHEGELIEHPVNTQMYYVCRNFKLYERDCGKGRIFFKDMNQCITVPRVNNRFPQKRSVDMENENEFVLCSENEKRSVPSNCSQYEICLDQVWKRRTCSNFRYYNPEQQKCLEPRDDLVCLYAKVTTLPTCNSTIEFKLMKAKSCQQYYRCQKEKWRLKSCGKQQYFNSQIGACLSMPLNDPNFQCDTKESVSEVKVYSTEDNSCQHLTLRYFEGNCAMYLMCLDNDWWYQFCPMGMYFNRSLNYCIPDLEQQCLNSTSFKNKEIVDTADEFANETCLQDGALRPSALACNRYFICFKTKWQMQHCNSEEFYDVSNAKCSLDLEGICLQLNTDCMAGEKRIYNPNCAAYEQCSDEGTWLRRECPLGQFYDGLLKDCVFNDGSCSKHGFKRVCKPKEIMSVPQNCSMFYYCSQSNWQLGNCLKGFMYSADYKTCLPSSLEDICKPLNLEVSTHVQVFTATVTETDLCKGQLDGTSVAHPEDCTRFYICIQEMNSHEMQCSKGSYFEASMGYCRPNDGACRLALTGVCENASDGSSVAHPTDCQSYYKCSTINGTELLKCPEGQYYHKFIRQCRIDHGECKKDMAQKCIGLEHGTKLAHDSYCNIYYACVKGLAIPVECPDNHQFNPILGICVLDEEQQCQNGQLIDGNLTYSCGNLADGSYIPDRQDCTRYYICTNGQALHKKCSGSTYFDSQLLLCVPDDGSCPFVDEDVEQNNPVAPDPIVCENKHGFLMMDPFNCNNFYACVHNKLKHERCYSNQFFNATWLQCQTKPSTETNATEVVANGALRVSSQQCSDDIFGVDKLCSELAEGSSIAEQDDCRRYITCQEKGEEPLSQRCRNGESFDSLLGFCRQNDGTCSLDNGQRVGECSGKHGQLARDASNCRGYFVCINGQKIAQTCQDDEFFSKTQNICLKDTLQICGVPQLPEEVTKQSCTGLSESILYPYIYDNCRSYFQCFNGEAKIHKCADDLYFDPATIKCVKGKTECLMPAQSLHRSQESAQTFTKLCSNKDFNTPYANLENNCRSFYFCYNNGKVSHQLCPLGKKFDKDLNICRPEILVNCNK